MLINLKLLFSGSIFIPGFLLKFMKLSDFVVGMIAAAVTSIASCATAFAKTIIILYLRKELIMI